MWVIANPSAGSGRGLHHAGLVTRALTAAGIGCRLVVPDTSAATHRAAEDAGTSGASAILVAGGDGTVHDVLPALVDRSVPLGVIAGGSGDDIAAALGFPIDDPAQVATFMVEAISQGHRRSVDLGTATCADGSEHHFVGVLSTGFDSAVNERANRMTRLGGQRYNVAIVRELASFRPVPYDVSIDGERIQREGMLVAVGNGHRYGGGMLVCPSAEHDDGLLDLTWLGAVSRPRFLRALPSVYSGTHVDLPYVTTHRGRVLTIDAPGQVAYADGERLGPLPITVGIRPGALQVLSG